MEIEPITPDPETLRPLLDWIMPVLIVLLVCLLLYQNTTRGPSNDHESHKAFVHTTGIEIPYRDYELLKSHLFILSRPSVESLTQEHEQQAEQADEPNEEKEHEHRWHLLPRFFY